MKRPDRRPELPYSGEPRNPMGTAFKWTLFPILATSLLSLFGVFGDGVGYFGEDGLGVYAAWFGALIYGFLALMVGVIALLASVFDSSGKTAQVAGGILGGVAVGVVVLAVTCFINIGTSG